MKQQPQSAGIKSESSERMPGHSGGDATLTPPCTTRSSSTMKRNTSIDDDGDVTPADIVKEEAKESKRRKASLNLWSHKGKECTEAWRVPVNEVATQGLCIVSKESDGSLLLSFDTAIQSIVVVFKEQCLSTRYPMLKLMPGDIHTIKRNSLRTKKDLKARLFTRDDQNKPRSFDVIFPTTEDCETFLEKIQLSCYQRVDSSSPTRYEIWPWSQITCCMANSESSEVMDELFEEGLWLEKKTKISGTVAKTRFLEVVELE